MPTTNLSLAKHLDGSPVSDEDIKLGLKVTFPSGCGGVLDHECVSIDDKQAKFESINPDWPRTYVMEFDQPDFTLEDFNQLLEALKHFNSLGRLMPTDEHRAIVRRAHELGYAHQTSWTQASWSEKGIKAFRDTKDALVKNETPGPGLN